MVSTRSRTTFSSNAQFNKEREEFNEPASIRNDSSTAFVAFSQDRKNHGTASVDPIRAFKKSNGPVGPFAKRVQVNNINTKSAEPVQVANKAADYAEQVEVADKAADCAEPVQEANKAADCAEPAREANKASDYAQPVKVADKAADYTEPVQASKKGAVSVKRVQVSKKGAVSAKPVKVGGKKRTTSALEPIGNDKKRTTSARASNIDLPTSATEAVAKETQFASVPFCITDEHKKLISAVLAGGNAGLVAFTPLFNSLQGYPFQCPEDKRAYWAAISSVVTPRLIEELQNCTTMASNQENDELVALMDTYDYCIMLNSDGFFASDGVTASDGITANDGYDMLLEWEQYKLFL